MAELKAQLIAYEPKLSNVVRRLPFTSIQEAIMHKCDEYPEAGFSQVDGFVVNIQGIISFELLKLAVESLAAIHAVLKGRVSKSNKEIVIDSESEGFCDYYDLSSTYQTALKKDEMAIIKQLISDVALLHEDVLCKFAIVKKSENHCDLVIVVHQLLCDGWSLDVLLEDVSNIYSSFLGRCIFLDPNRPSYMDYLAKINTEYTQDRARAQNYWRAELLNAESPGGGVRNFGALPIEVCVFQRHKIGESLNRSIRLYGETHGLTLFSLLCTSVAYVIAGSTGVSQFFMGIPIAYHPIGGMEHTVGAMSNLVPLNVNLSNSNSFLENCKFIAMQIRNSQENWTVDIRELLGDAQLEKVISNKIPMIANVSNIHKYKSSDIPFGDAQVNYSGIPIDYTEFGFGIQLLVSQNELEIVSRCNPSYIINNTNLGFGEQVEQIFAENLSVGDTRRTKEPEFARDCEAANEERDVVVPLNVSPSETSIYFICGVGLYGPLAKALSQEFECFGIYVAAEEEFLDLNQSTKHLSLSELASLYVAAIQGHSPTGPYIVSGISFGAVLAYEVARQLKFKGAEVSGLVLLDPVLPTAVSRSWIKTLASVVNKVRAGRVPATPNVSIESVPKNLPDSQALVREARNQQLWKVMRQNVVKAFFKSSPTYEGRVLVVKATDRSNLENMVVRDDLGWRPFLKGDTAYAEVPGSHLGILKNALSAGLISSYLKNGD